MSAFVQYAPYDLAEGTWDERRDEIGQEVLGLIGRYCDVDDVVEHIEVLGPPDIEARVGLTGGHIFQGECTPDQMWWRRLHPRSPGGGVYLCGAATHPAGSVIGLNGRNAAMAVLADLCPPDVGSLRYRRAISRARPSHVHSHVMELFLDTERRGGLAAQLYAELHQAIASGRWASATGSPPSRVLAGDLGVSRFTVSEVYSRLTAEGYVTGRARGGTVVTGDAGRRAGGRRGGGAAPTDRAARIRRFDRNPLPGALRPPPGNGRSDPVPDRAVAPLDESGLRAGSSTTATRPVIDLRRSLAHWIARSRASRPPPTGSCMTAGANTRSIWSARVPPIRGTRSRSRNRDIRRSSSCCAAWAQRRGRARRRRRPRGRRLAGVHPPDLRDPFPPVPVGRRDGSGTAGRVAAPGQRPSGGDRRRTTTTVSSATAHDRSSRCSGSIATAGSSTWRRSPRCSRRRCGSASRLCRPASWRRWSRCASASTGARRPPPSRRSPRSSTTGTSTVTSDARRASTGTANDS